MVWIGIENYNKLSTAGLSFTTLATACGSSVSGKCSYVVRVHDFTGQFTEEIRVSAFLSCEPFEQDRLSWYELTNSQICEHLVLSEYDFSVGYTPFFYSVRKCELCDKHVCCAVFDLHMKCHPDKDYGRFVTAATIVTSDIARRFGRENNEDELRLLDALYWKITKNIFTAKHYIANSTRGFDPKSSR